MMADAAAPPKPVRTSTELTTTEREWRNKCFAHMMDKYSIGKYSLLMEATERQRAVQERARSRSADTGWDSDDSSLGEDLDEEFAIVDESKILQPACADDAQGSHRHFDSFCRRAASLSSRRTPSPLSSPSQLPSSPPPPLPLPLPQSPIPVPIPIPIPIPLPLSSSTSYADATGADAGDGQPPGHGQDAEAKSRPKRRRLSQTALSFDDESIATNTERKTKLPRQANDCVDNLNDTNNNDDTNDDTDDDTDDDRYYDSEEESWCDGEDDEQNDGSVCLPLDRCLSGAGAFTLEELLAMQAGQLARLRRLYREQFHRLHDDLRAYHAACVKQRHEHLLACLGDALPVTQDGASQSLERHSARLSRNWLRVCGLLLPKNPVQTNSSVTRLMASDDVERRNWARCVIEACPATRVKPSEFCFRHLMHDSRQRFFKSCQHVIPAASGQPASVCGYPILICREPPFCSAHADLHGMVFDESTFAADPSRPAPLDAASKPAAASGVRHLSVELLKAIAVKAGGQLRPELVVAKVDSLLFKILTKYLALSKIIADRNASKDGKDADDPTLTPEPTNDDEPTTTHENNGQE